MATNKAVEAVTEEKMVEIKIPRSRKDTEDVFVSVNNRTFLVQRGVKVKVPECVAEVLNHQEEMLEEIMAFENEKATK